MARKGRLLLPSTNQWASASISFKGRYRKNRCLQGGNCEFPWRRLQMATMQSAVEDLKDERVPQCLYWNVDQVADWIEDLGFPYYRV